MTEHDCMCTIGCWDIFTVYKVYEKRDERQHSYFRRDIIIDTKSKLDLVCLATHRHP